MSDALTPLRHAYGVDAPGSAPPGGPEPALLAQTRAAIEATVAAQTRRPSDVAFAAVLAEAERQSATALAPLAAVRALYGETTTGAPDAVEAAILSQARAAVEQTIDARPQAPSGAVLAAIVDRAAEATRAAPLADALVEATALAPLAVAYGLPTRAAADPTETTLLVQTRTLLDAAPSPSVAEASLTAVLARAAEATRLAEAPPESAVEAPALAALAAAYGLPLVASVTPAPVETALLSQMRTLLDAAPDAGGPAERTLAAVLAHAAAPATPPPAAAPDRPAADRSPVRAARSYRRVGAWASAATLAIALVVALLPDSAGAPELATVQTPTVVAESVDVPGVTPDGEPVEPVGEPVSEAYASNETPALSEPTPSEPLAAAAVPSAPSPAAPVAFVAPPAPRAETRPATRPEARPQTRPAPRPDPAQSADPALTFASTTPAPASEWDAADDVRVLSLRLQELRRGNQGLAWDTPVEAFGAPTTRSALSAPAIQSVRATVPPARARLRTDPASGD